MVVLEEQLADNTRINRASLLQRSCAINDWPIRLLRKVKAVNSLMGLARHAKSDSAYA
jgi:hypothetical protein